MARALPFFAKGEEEEGGTIGGIEEIGDFPSHLLFP